MGAGHKGRRARVTAGSRAGCWEPCVFTGYCLDEKKRPERWHGFSVLHRTDSEVTELRDGQQDGSW